MQAVALINTATNKINSEIPVGWYPSTVCSPPNDGKRILVANARGTPDRYPNPGQLIDKAANNDLANYSQYTLNQIESDVETIAVPTA